MRVCPSDGPPDGPSVTCYFFGLLGATNAVYTALFFSVCRSFVNNDCFRYNHCVHGVSVSVCLSLSLSFFSVCRSFVNDDCFRYNQNTRTSRFAVSVSNNRFYSHMKCRSRSTVTTGKADKNVYET